MKKQIQFFMMVVVALISGFPQSVKAQVKSDSCIHLRFKFYFSDSSFWDRDIKDLNELVSYAETKINSIPGLTRKFKCTYVDTQKLTKADEIGGYYWSKIDAQGGQWAGTTVFIKKKEKDTLIMPVYLGHMKMFRFYYPSAEYGQNLCNPVIARYPLVGARNIALIRPDSLGYTDPFMKLIFVRAILQTITGYKTSLPGIMHEDAWKITDSWDQAIATAVNTQSCYCLPRFWCNATKIEDAKEIERKIIVYDRKIMNDNLNFISVYDLMGRPILRLSHSEIDLKHLPPGIYFIQEDKKIPQKHFFY